MLRAACLLLAGLAMAGMSSAHGEGTRLLGAIEGRVRNGGGTPQQGAIVVLETGSSQVIARTRTGLDGAFRFDSLAPASYQVKVWAASFMPASRTGIPVRAGMESTLNVQLASLLSSIELVSTVPSPGKLISEQWKWVLRSDPALRPVLRMKQDPIGGIGRTPPTVRSAARPATARGFVHLSGGDAGSSLSGTSGDLGTAFALATSVFGTRELQFSGNVGYASATGAPSTVFRTRYSSMGMERAPDVEFTVRQLGMRDRVGQALVSGPGFSQALPALRSYSVKLADRQNFGEHMRLDYGLMMEAVAFLDRVNVVSPFAKLSVDTGGTSGIEAAFSSGAPGTELLPTAPAASQADSLSSLSSFPRVSLWNGAARVQRSTAYELGYRTAVGATTLRASVYSERMNNQAFMLSGDTSALRTDELLPDAGSRSSIFNFGNFQSNGFMVSATRPVASQWTVTALYGNGGALRTDATDGPVNTAAALREKLRMAPTQWASARVGGILPRAGTYVSAAYIWTPAGRLIPTHAYLTQNWQPNLGVNFQIRQPVPVLSGQFGRFEITAEVRNLLAQGYQPVQSSDGRTMLLVPFPRSLRGGVSFIF